MTIGYALVSSLIYSWLAPGRASGHQKLSQIPRDRQLPDGDWSTKGTTQLMVELTLVKCRIRLDVYPGANVQP